MANFTWTPKQTTPHETQYAAIQTDSEDYKKESLLIDSTGRRRWDLLFTRVEQADYILMQAHYDGQYGPHASFTWKTVPVFIGSGVDITVRYVSFAAKPIEVKRWEIRITFEEAV